MVGLGALGMFLSIFLFFFPLVPSFWTVSALAIESYLILAIWALLGLVLFYVALRNDTENHLGKSAVMWVAMLLLVVLSTSLWVRQRAIMDTREVVLSIDDYFADHTRDAWNDRALRERDARYLEERTDDYSNRLLNHSFVQTVLVFGSMSVLIAIFSTMRQRNAAAEARRLAIEQAAQARSDFLSNVSHDLRTPMNAIVGYTNLALNEELDLPQTREYLRKIDAASAYMLELVNEVLDMGRIESGRLTLDIAPINIRDLVDDAGSLFVTQMNEKGIDYRVDADGIEHEWVQEIT